MPTTKFDPRSVQKSPIDNQKQPVKYVFTSPMRVLQTIVLSLVALFFPVILALFINGFNFSLLDLRGSAVWFAIMVPVVPIYILKLDVIDRYERPWTYVMKEDGSFHRYHRKPSFKSLSNAFKTILQALVIPPVCFATWFAILSLCIMVYLTAFGLGD